MNLGGNKMVDVVNQRFQQHTCQTRRTAHENPGKYQKLISAEPVVQPVENQFITACLFKSVFLKIPFKL